MKDNCIKWILFNLFTALLLVFSSNLVAAQEIGNPFDIFKSGKHSTQKSSTQKSESFNEGFQGIQESLSNLLEGKKKSQSPQKSERPKPIKRVVVYEGYSQNYVGTTKKLMTQNWS